MRRRGPARRLPGGGGASRGCASAESLTRLAATRAGIAVRVSGGGGWGFGSSVTVAATNGLRPTNASTSRSCPQPSPPGRNCRFLPRQRTVVARPPRGIVPPPKGVVLCPRLLFTADLVWFAGFTAPPPALPNYTLSQRERNRLRRPPTGTPPLNEKCKPLPEV